MLVGFAEGLGAAKTYAAKAGYDIDANRELLGLGAANLGAGLASGMVVNGSLSKTAVNGGAGARSQVSGLTAAALTVVTLLFLTGLFEKLPEATLAAIVIAAVIELVDIASLRRLWRAGAGPLVAVGSATPGAPTSSPPSPPWSACWSSTPCPAWSSASRSRCSLLIARTSRPHVAALVPAGDRIRAERTCGSTDRRHPDRTPIPGVLVVRVEGPLIFANADFVRDQVRSLRRAPGGRRTPVGCVVLDGETMPGIDVTAAAMLVQLHDELARGRDPVSASRRASARSATCWPPRRGRRRAADLPDHRRRDRRPRPRARSFTGPGDASRRFSAGRVRPPPSPAATGGPWRP